MGGSSLGGCQTSKENGQPDQDCRKVTTIQITSCYNASMQKTLKLEPEWPSVQSSVSSNSRRPHRVPLLLAKNGKLKRQFRLNLDNGQGCLIRGVLASGETFESLGQNLA